MLLFFNFCLTKQIKRYILSITIKRLFNRLIEIIVLLLHKGVHSWLKILYFLTTTAAAWKN